MEEGIKLAADNKILFFEVSAKENTNLSEAFQSLTKEMISKINDIITKKEKNNILTPKKEVKNHCCK